ncbi:MAG TPA: acyl-CoA dehydrogenase family protein [Nevskiaceae bacterium]
MIKQSKPGNPVLAAVRGLVHEELAPLAGRIDRDGYYPAEFLRRLGAAGGFGASIPQPDGGAGLGLADQIDVTSAVAEECGSSAFLTWCQSVCGWYLLHAPNPTVKRRYLARVARGELLAGSGMSNTAKHLAGIEKMHLQARHDGADYRVNGILPWVSNLGEDHLLITTAQLADQRYVMFAIRCNASGIELHACPPFSGMEGTGTFNPRFHEVHVQAANVIAGPAEFAAYMTRIKPGFVLGQVGMGLGLVTGCLRTMHRYDATMAEVNGYLDEQQPELQRELGRLREATRRLADAAQAGRPSLIEILRARAGASELGLRAANAAVLHAGARGYLMSNPAQRRLREAIFVAIVTPALKHLRKEIHDLTRSCRQPARESAESAAA